MSLAQAITEIKPGKLILTIPPDRPPCGSLRYALGFPFQAGPRTCGLMVMRMTEETPNYGFLDGTDVILLDELKPPHPSQIFVASRSEIENNDADKTQRLLLRSPLLGGFVPLGALRADGTPHPYAGTGFGLAQAHRFSFRDGRFSWGDPGRVDLNEIFQFSYDGKTFTSKSSELRSQNDEASLRIGDTGWSILVSGLTNAIPDGDDLLFAVMAARVDGTAVGIGIIRWVFRQGTWQAVGYDPVVTTSGPVPQGPNPKERCPWMEPSLARANDNSLFFSARGADSFQQEGDVGQGYGMSVWHSVKAGEWNLVLDEPKTRLNSPVTVNVATDGSPYLVSNPYDPAFVPETTQTGRGREKLVLWPLAAEGTKLAPFRLVRNCLTEFGQPPTPIDSGAIPENWMADHPNGVTVRLKDGHWHHLLAYRICHSPRYIPSGAKPSPHSGCYIDEIISQGPAQPAWRFAEDQTI